MKPRKPYPTDLTDEQWELLKPMLPPDKPRGRKRRVDLRDILNAILYLLRSGCSWRMLPHDFPPRQTVTCWLAWFSDSKPSGRWGLLEMPSCSKT